MAAWLDPMNILIVNPNSDEEMTAAIQEAAEAFAAGDFSVTARSAPGAPAFIETYEDAFRAVPGMVALVRGQEAFFDAFVIACHCDPYLDLLKETSCKPVIGIGEASMKLASILGHRFSVISASRHSIPNKEALIRSYHLEGLLASVRAIEKSTSMLESYLEAARRAVAEDMAEVIVLGCACATGMDKELQRRLGVPVLDGVICALILAAGFARYGVATSKVRRYNPQANTTP